MFEKFRKNLSRAFKIILFLFLEVIIFFYITRYWGGMTLPNFQTTLLVIVLLSIINAIIWPIISYISLRFLVFTLGLGTFLLDGVILYGISLIIPGVSIGGFALFSIPLLFALINSVLSILLGFDTDSTYYKLLLKREIQPAQHIDRPGYLFLEIDGLAHKVLLDAIDEGKMPYLKECLDKGTHKLVPWQTDLSSQTSSSQAGILHGNNSNIPAFRWVEKENDNKIISSNSLSCAISIEKMISNGKGLLSHNGASRSNLFSGDAEDYMLTYSKFQKLSEFYTLTWYYLYSSPYVIARILVLFIMDMILEVFSRIVHVIKNIKPRIHRGLFYFVARSGANVVMREATTLALIGDIYAGNYNMMYATYMGYDEIAHHSGIRDYDAYYALKQIDNQFIRIDKAVHDAKRDYHLIFLSDHGQSEGPTFKQKYGLTLNDLVKEFLPDHITIHSILYSNEDHFAENFRLKPIAKENKEKLDERIEDTKEKLDEKIDNTKERLSLIKEKVYSQKRIKEVMEKKEVLKDKIPILERLQSISDEYGMGVNLSGDELVKDETAQAIVLASGNLGLIYFTDWKRRLSYEQIEDAFPGLIHGLSSHEGIGFVMVRSSVLGTIVLSDDNVYYMDNDEYAGDSFLDVYGEHVIEKLKRTDGFEHVPDILVNSKYDSENDEVYAFEELIGSHGGVGGTQQEAFIMCPSDWEADDNIFGAENVHQFFKKEIKNSWNED